MLSGLIVSALILGLDVTCELRLFQSHQSDHLPVPTRLKKIDAFAFVQV